MTTAVPSPATQASGPREPSRDSSASLALRRAPVLLRLPALQPNSRETQVNVPPSPKQESPKHEAPKREAAKQKATKHETPKHPSSAVGENAAPRALSEPADDAHELPEARDEDAHPKERRRQRERDPDTQASRRERGSRRPRDTAKKSTPLSQWIMGGCMLAVGVVGFFALSGDFGGQVSDEPPADGWSKPAEEFQADSQPFSEPHVADAPITVHREPTPTAAPDRHWSNPAEGEIARTPSPSTAPAMPNWMNGAAPSPSLGGAPTPAEQQPSAMQTSAEQRITAPGGDRGHAEMNLAPPLTPPGNTGPAQAYPTTGASGLGAAAPSPATQSSYPTTGYNEAYQPQAAPGYGPAARTGMWDGAPSANYPTYPTTGASSPGAFPTDVTPPPMSPRYERIR